MPDKRVPLGKPLKFTEKQLRFLSEVSPADIVKAQEFWRNAAPDEFQTLLDAQTIDDQEDEEEQ